MGLQQKGEEGDFDNPHIYEDYYIGKLSERDHPDINSDREDDAFPTYDRDECLGMVMRLKITRDHRDAGNEGVVLPFFAPAKLSVARDGVDENPSRLAANLKELGILEDVLEVLGVRDPVMTGEEKWMAESQVEYNNLVAAIRHSIGDRHIRFQVEDNENGDGEKESQVSKLKNLVDEDE
ncbi:hypothetical protein [Halomontanus rarus]|uniref:hypothetical protein n=1 Tax=Halomontanus rarus TaxID=3034020 RepID=UPI001A9A2A98